MMPWVANAQSPLTVCEGTTTNSSSPIRSGYGTQSECIYPASMLENMDGGTITSVKFFASTTSASYINTVTVYVEEVANTVETTSAWQYTKLLPPKFTKVLRSLSRMAKW